MHGCKLSRPHSAAQPPFPTHPKHSLAVAGGAAASYQSTQIAVTVRASQGNAFAASFRIVREDGQAACPATRVSVAASRLPAMVGRRHSGRCELGRHYRKCAYGCRRGYRLLVAEISRERECSIGGACSSLTRTLSSGLHRSVRTTAVFR